MNLRSALLVVFVALTIVLASTTVYESGIRTTVTSTSTMTNTSTSTLTSTLAQTTTVTSTTRVTTSMLYSSIGTGAALVLNTSDGLGLSLQVVPSNNFNFTSGFYGNYTITVRETNLLNSVNNVKGADEWAYTKESVAACLPVPYPDFNPTIVEFALVQGHYGQNNFTESGEALPLYNPSGVGCLPLVCVSASGSGCVTTYAFQPESDILSSSGSSGVTSVSISASGYWTGSQGNGPATFKTFSPGYYTVIGADQWGNMVFLPFYVPF